MTREQELKFRVHDRAAVVLGLGRLGIELSAPVQQLDQAYAPRTWADHDDRTGVAFARLRTVGTRHTFTIKQPVTGVLDCTEYETEVADREHMHHAILAMGYRPTVRITKTRQTARHGDIAICLDTLDGLGDFLEIEYLADQDAPPAAIEARLMALVPHPIEPADRLHVGYDSLATAAHLPQVRSPSA